MDVNFYKELPFFLYTPNGNYIADIFSVYTADALSDFYDQSFASEDEFRQYIEIVRNKSKYFIDVEVDYLNYRIITLYSCFRKYGYSKYDRYFINAVLRKV